MGDMRLKVESIPRSINEVFASTYIIPEYQRPYSWGEDQCYALFQDIVSSFELNYTAGGNFEEESYYLGSIILYKDNTTGSYMVIDGQQRLTTLMILLKVLYEKLQHERQLTGIKKLMFKEIKYSTDLSDEIRITTKVFHKKNDNYKLENVISSTSVNELLDLANTQEKNKYLQSFKYLYNNYNEWVQREKITTDAQFKFLDHVAENITVIAMICPSQEQALTIFRTLNDRGMPLRNSDVFKSNLYYEFQPEYPEKRDLFIRNWECMTMHKEDDEPNEDIDVLIDLTFDTYRHFIRAKNKDNRELINLRKYLNINKAFDKPENVTKMLISIQAINIFIKSSNIVDYDNSNIEKYLHILKQTSNDNWIYLVSAYIYYFSMDKTTYDYNNPNSIFDAIKGIKENKELEVFLQKIVIFMLTSIIIGKKNNNDVLLRVSAILSGLPSINDIAIAGINESEFAEKLNSTINDDLLVIRNNLDKVQKAIELKTNRKIFYLLLAYEYGNSQSIIENFSIEHILPKKMIQDDEHWNKSNHKDYVEDIGNLILLEKSKNIGLKNKWFESKIKEYKKSSIIEAQNLAKTYATWTPTTIDGRRNYILSTIKRFIGLN